jgi:hypothetical protein
VDRDDVAPPKPGQRRVYTPTLAPPPRSAGGGSPSIRWWWKGRGTGSPSMTEVTRRTTSLPSLSRAASEADLPRSGDGGRGRSVRSPSTTTATRRATVAPPPRNCTWEFPFIRLESFSDAPRGIFPYDPVVQQTSTGRNSKEL